MFNSKIQLYKLAIIHRIQIEKVEKINQLAAWKLTKSCRFGTPVNLALDLLSIKMYPCRFWYPITFFDAKVVVGIFRSTSYKIEKDSDISNENYHIVKSRFFKNRQLYWSNLPQNSNCERELVQKSRVQIPVGEGQFFCPVFFSCFYGQNEKWQKNWPSPDPCGWQGFEPRILPTEDLNFEGD